MSRSTTTATQPGRRISRGRFASSGARTTTIKADVGQVAECRRLVEEAAGALGGLDILVNNAGITLWQDFFETDEAHWDATIDTNLKSVFFCTQAAAKIMRDRALGPGRQHLQRGESFAVPARHPLQRLQGRDEYALAGTGGRTRRATGSPSTPSPPARS